MRQDGQRPNRVRLEVSDWSEGCLSKALKETLKDLLLLFRGVYFLIAFGLKLLCEVFEYRRVAREAQKGDFQKARLCTCSWNRIRQGVGGNLSM